MCVCACVYVCACAMCGWDARIRVQETNGSSPPVHARTRTQNIHTNQSRLCKGNRVASPTEKGENEWDSDCREGASDSCTRGLLVLWWSANPNNFEQIAGRTHRSAPAIE